MATSGRTSIVSVPVELQLKLDPETEALSLLSILKAFDGPVNEERAWAVLHQAAKTAQQCFAAAQKSATTTNSHHHHHNNNNHHQSDTSSLSTDSQDLSFYCCSASEASQLWINKDGTVHPRSFKVPSHKVESEGRTVAECQSQLVSGLGWVLFEALDYGNKREEQNVLSPDLELLIDLMTAADNGGESHSAEDEGIERDSGDPAEPSDMVASCSPASSSGCPSVTTVCVATVNDGSTTGASTGGSTTGSSSGSSSAPGAAVTSLAHVMDRCRMQISSAYTAGQADAHFRAVCRALVAETLEFSDFLIKVSSAPENWQDLRNKPGAYSSDSELAGLHLADWAKLWVQVIRQLRIGVKLKARQVGDYDDLAARKPIEYELTPYEMMMDDIRCRRYRLRPVMVDGAIPPRVKKDAHAVILEFIRSRPPLRKASERKLNPPARRVSTPVEALMESIRQHPGRRQLRPTRSLMVVKDVDGDVSVGGGAAQGSNNHRSSGDSNAGTTTNQRRLVKADFDTLLNFSHEDEDDFEESPMGTPPPMGQQPRRSSISAGTPLNHRGGMSNGFRRDAASVLAVADDLMVVGSNSSPASRRHSMAGFPQPLSRTVSAPFSKSHSHNSNLSSYLAGQHHQDPRIRLHPGHLPSSDSGSLPCSGPSSSSASSSGSIPGSPASPSHSNGMGGGHHLQDDFLRSEAFRQEVQGKLVTLEELVHMRRVLTAASIENLPLESSIKDDVIKGKVCFACRKTRLSFFNWSWHHCKLCSRTVCTKCCTKMRIPSEPFDSIAVSELSIALDKLKVQGRPSSPLPPSSSSSPAPSSSFLSQLKLPQFKIQTPGGTNSRASSPCPPTSRGATPSGSPVLPRSGGRGGGTENNNKGGGGGLAGAGQRFLHQALARHQSLSANNTPVRTPLSAQASLTVTASGPGGRNSYSRKPSASSGNDCYVCRDCQSLIEHIVYHPVHTLEPRDHPHHHHSHHHHLHHSSVQHISLP